MDGGGNGVTIYRLPKLMSDAKIASLEDAVVRSEWIKIVIDDNADVYDEETGELLARYRKRQINKKVAKAFFNDVIKFASMPTSNRGRGTGNRYGKLGHKVRTNIIGYFNRMSAQQNHLMTKRGIKLPIHVRPTRFLRDYPEEYERSVIPLAQEIDKRYRKYVPDRYAAQRKKADETYFKIPGTAFTTLTVNVNFDTTLHKDRGDDPEGFGNLVVIEEGKYKGGYTCFPQYGVGFDCRMGDILFMNVHKMHGNVPMSDMSEGARRLSVVAYLRKGVWEKSRGMSEEIMKKQIEVVNSLGIVRRGRNKTRKVFPA